MKLAGMVTYLMQVLVMLVECKFLTPMCNIRYEQDPSLHDQLIKYNNTTPTNLDRCIVTIIFGEWWWKLTIGEEGEELNSIYKIVNYASAIVEMITTYVNEK